jgi:hypothetical protein
MAAQRGDKLILGSTDRGVRAFNIRLRYFNAIAKKMADFFVIKIGGHSGKGIKAIRINPTDLINITSLSLFFKSISNRFFLKPKITLPDLNRARIFFSIINNEERLEFIAKHAAYAEQVAGIAAKKSAKNLKAVENNNAFIEHIFSVGSLIKKFILLTIPLFDCIKRLGLLKTK